MSIRRKIALLIFLVFFSGFGVSYVLYRIFITEHLKKLDLIFIDREFDTFFKSIENNISFVDSIAKNEAYWDDLYNFTLNPNEKFVKSNFDSANETLYDLKINFYLVLNRLLNTALYRCNLDLNSCSHLIEAVKKYIKGEQSGLIKIGDNIIAVSSKYILPTEKKSKPAGLLIIGKLINMNELADFMRTAPQEISRDSPLKKIRHGIFSVSIYETDGDYFGYRVYGRDISGKKLLLHSGIIDKTVSEKGKKFFLILNLILLFIFLSVMLVLYYGIDRLVTVPIHNLVRSIKNISINKDLSEDFNVDYGSKEINIISKEISKLLRTIKGLLGDIEEKNKLFKAIAENTPIGIYIFSEKFEYVNPAVEKITGYSKEEIIGKNISFLLTEADKEMRKKIIEAVRRRLKGEVFRNEFQIKIKTKNGETKDILVIANTVFLSDKPYGLGIAVDITQTKRLERELLEQAERDSLTGLYNRLGLTKKIEEFLDIFSRENKKFFLLFIDLNKFKNINDSFGHQIGDTVLKTIGKRLKENFRKIDVIARFGGDEFGILITTYSKFDDISQILTKIIRLIEEPVHINELSFIVTASIGISVFPDDGTDANTLLKRADIAMYRAKEKSRKENKSSFIFFSEEFERKIKEKIEIERELREVLKNKKEEFTVLYQPIYNLKTMKISKLEALVRWSSSKFGEIPPSRFINISEETGLIKEISNIVLDRVCNQILLWKRKGLDIKVSINISPIEFMDRDFVDRLLSKLRPSCLEKNISIEITENVLIENVLESREKIKKLKEQGIDILLDDFGKGYSSLTYLKKFPISMLKIDREFIKDLPKDKEDVEIVKTIVKLSEILQIETVAEGIESREQLEILKNIGCTYGQGFFLGKPLYPSEIERIFPSNIH
ncbi:EAL domain-containing protein [Persephonella atlantica]|uniref:EAL domain-containing protein n=1 Tax=Persephonella atlantica TaxID=2699429 RepID=A0ABS1GFP9_9AQUI|nr:EAL domain-containing protein [Persephonella atlantica]MBK3331602.1 EAL domain-containing protein [Persephonella atlantica]